MKLIVGLGNPGAQYLLTRHNIGFIALDHWAFLLPSSSKASPNWKKDFQSEYLKDHVSGESVCLQKPQTFMNLSGRAVREIMQFYKIPMSGLLVVHDELDLPFGKMKFVYNRGQGGHNGIKSLHSELGSGEYARLRLGVGRPPHPAMNVADYVLQNFNSDELTLLKESFLPKISEAMSFWVQNDLQKASTRFNS